MPEEVDRVLAQEAPFPLPLEELLIDLEYRPNWRVTLENRDRGQGSRGLTLCVWTVGFDTYHPEKGRNYRVVHFFIVPAASYNKQSWRHWLFDRLLDVERHEAAEFFKVGDARPYAPHHGHGHDPYIIFEHGVDVDRRTSFKNETKIERGDLDEVIEHLELSSSEGHDGLESLIDRLKGARADD